MKEKICMAIMLIGFLVLLCIINSVDNGAAFSNAFWGVPILFVVWKAGKVGGLFDEV